MKRETELAPLPAFLMLAVRGVALWVLIPGAVISWLIVVPWMLKHAHPPKLFITWVDYNFAVALERGPLRPLISPPHRDWLPATRMKELTTRTRFNDVF